MHRPSPLVILHIGVLSLLLLTATACGGSSEGPRACGAVEHPPLDPAALVHVLGDGAEIAYSTDPPTSGPHKSGPNTAGVVDAPIPRPVQVAILERGDVLLQHLPDLPPADIRSLQDLAGPRVVVAPNPDLSTAVVITAWTYVRRCTAVDVSALQAFIRERSGKGPDG